MTLLEVARSSVAGAYFAELPRRQITPEPAPAPPGLRRGGDGGAGALDQGGRAAPADRGAPDRRRQLRAGHGRAPLARRPRRPAWTPSPRSSGRPTTTTCSATRCWRTCTAPSSTRWRRRRPTRQMLEDFGCTHEELAAADRPLPAADQQHAAAAQALPGRPAPGRRRRAVRRPRPLAARRRGRRAAGPARPAGGRRGDQRPRPGGDRRRR